MMMIVVWVSSFFNLIMIYSMDSIWDIVAILKINGEELLQIQDDGGFLKYVKTSH